MYDLEEDSVQDALDVLYVQLDRCQQLLSQGYASGGISWLNNLCGHFLQFANRLQALINDLQREGGSSPDVSSLCLCLAQICLCIKYLERTIRAEQTAGGVPNSASRRHFLDRIKWCLDKLPKDCRALLHAQTPEDKEKPEKGSDKLFESFEFSELIFLSQDYVKPYSTFTEGKNHSIRSEKHILEGFRKSKWLRGVINVMLGQVLGFANVALKADKPALSALCQKVLREYRDFEDEWTLCEEDEERPRWSRRLKAVTLDNSLTDLMNYVNDALMRLVYTCFLDFEKYSVDILRAKMRQCGLEDTVMDEFIADFDINLDRTTQIGLFVVHFTQTTRMKTLVRSCVASLEALDTCLIPSLHGKNLADMHSEILEEHFNEEVAKFKTAIYEIVDSKCFASCYAEMLTQCIEVNEKQFNKENLKDIIQMGTFLIEHFQLPVKSKFLTKRSVNQRDLYMLFGKVSLMLHECQAILVCADQVEPGRILKRLKILRAILRKFINEFSRSSSGQTKGIIAPQIDIPKTFNLNSSQAMFEALGIVPSACTILYRDEVVQRAKLQGKTNDSQNGVNNIAQQLKALPQQRNNASNGFTMKSTKVAPTLALAPTPTPALQPQRCSVYRKESLRTEMFKRQKAAETRQACDWHLQNSASLQISEILDQLTSLSTNTANTST